MIFFPAVASDENYYVFTKLIDNNNSDKYATKYVGIELEDYIKVLKSFNARCNIFQYVTVDKYFF